MEDSSQAFEDNLKEWLYLADAVLSGDVTGESRRIITEQLAEIQRILQKKQREVEARLEGEIQREDAEIARLQESLHGVGRGQAEQTEAYDMMPLWYNLKMVEWQETYDALRADTEDTEKTILDRLITILKVTFDRCGEAVQQQHNELEFAARFPGEAGLDRDYKLPKRRDKVIVKSVMEDKKRGYLFSATTERIQKAYKHYVDACVEFAWVACLEEEPVQLVTNPRKECKPLLSHFTGESEVPRKSYVEWPAIVQNDVIRAAWQLYHRNKPSMTAIRQKQSEVVQHVQTLVHKRENEKIKAPRAVVYENDNVWESRTRRTSSISSSSFNSQRLSTASGSEVSFGHVHKWQTNHGRPTLVQGGGAEGKQLPDSAADKLRQSTGDAAYHISQRTKHPGGNSQAARTRYRTPGSITNSSISNDSTTSTQSQNYPNPLLPRDKRRLNSKPGYLEF